MSEKEHDTSPEGGAAYRADDYPPFAVTADLVVLTVRREQLLVLLVRRGGEPFKGAWALPGGFTQIDEDVADAAYRELEEEAGLGRGDVHLEQLATYGAPRRDPRMRVVSVAWLAFGVVDTDPRAGSDADDAAWVPVTEALAGDLAFDHELVLRDGLARARAKLEYTDLATRFVEAEFTLPELRRVYEAVWEVELDPGNFQRKAAGRTGFVEPTGATRPDAASGRAAATYRVRPGVGVVDPPLRPEGLRARAAAGEDAR